ncbi:MAG: hypothetical protein KC503_47255, partial [Myxococcales bacterium]|nr:hypothetical protein [Myxococcales bacterium]
MSHLATELHPDVVALEQNVLTAEQSGTLQHVEQLAQVTPRLRLACERLLIDHGTPYRPEVEEVELAVLSLGFDYAPGAARDAGFEARAGLLLESLGAVDLECLDHVAGGGTRANFVIDTEGDVDAICAFGAHAVPQLESLGWRVEVAPGYRWHVVRGGEWFADVSAADSASGDDWFNLELGIELDGERVDLLPALVALIERASSLRALKRGAKRCVALPLSQGRYLALSPERAEALVDVIYELYGGRPAMGPLQIPASELHNLSGLDRVFGRELRAPAATRGL